VIPELVIWRAANLLIRQHGEDAEIVAAQRADRMLDRNDHEGQRVWLRISSGCRATGSADGASALAGGVPQQHLVAPNSHPAVGLNLFHDVPVAHKLAGELYRIVKHCCRRLMGVIAFSVVYLPSHLHT